MRSRNFKNDIKILAFLSTLMFSELFCKNTNIVDFNYLIDNYSSLYNHDNQKFWEILNSYADELSKNKNENGYINFLRLSTVIIGNTDVSEYFNEKCEMFCLNDTESFFNAILSFKPKDIEKIFYFLREPLTIPKSDMDKLFIKYKDDNRYVILFKYYFQTNSYGYKDLVTKIPAFNKKEINITVSSYLNINYTGENIIDDNLKTAWVEGATGNGINEWIRFNFTKNVIITGFDIIIGYTKSNKLFYENNRVNEILLILSDGTEERYFFKDDKNWQYRLVPANTCNSMKIQILDIYKGTKYTDTCIGEIKIRGYIPK